MPTPDCNRPIGPVLIHFAKFLAAIWDEHLHPIGGRNRGQLLLEFELFQRHSEFRKHINKTSPAPLCLNTQTKKALEFPLIVDIIFLWHSVITNFSCFLHMHLGETFSRQKFLFFRQIRNHLLTKREFMLQLLESNSLVSQKNKSLGKTKVWRKNKKELTKKSGKGANEWLGIIFGASPVRGF